MADPATLPIVLSLGLEKPVTDFVLPMLSACDLRAFEADKLDTLIENPPNRAPALILVGNSLGTISPLEVAQFLRAQFQETKIFLISAERSTFERADLIKNGVTETYTLALDRSILKEIIEEALAAGLNIKSYRRVKVIDIEPDAPLDFDLNIYLPMNKKFVRFANSGDPLGADKAKKLSENHINNAYVSLDQMEKFYEHTASYLSKLNQPNSMSETERRDKIQGAVRSLLTGLLGNTDRAGTFDDGKALLADCQKIVQSYVLTSSSGNLFKQISRTMDESDGAYAHSSRVSTYCGLFALGLGLNNPEGVAIAGLFHDAGMALIPIEIQNKPASERTKQEQEIYASHINHSLDLIRSKKIIISDIIKKAIQQHHERFNGTGFPTQASGKAICIEAQVLALADEFDYLTSVTPGRKRLSPKEAIQHLQNEITKDPAKMIFDPALVKKLIDLFAQT